MSDPFGKSTANSDDVLSPRCDLSPRFFGGTAPSFSGRREIEQVVGGFRNASTSRLTGPHREKMFFCRTDTA